METFEQIVEMLPRMRETAERMRDIVLANVVMTGEIPSPPGGEARRVEFFVDRLAEYGLQNCSTDEKSNGFGLIPGETGARTLLVVANADTLVAETADQTVEIGTDSIVGPFVVDNSLALGALLSVPVLIEQLGLRPKTNILLMAASRCLGRGNLEGLKFFLENTPSAIHMGLCIEGVQLGRLNYASLGMLRGDIAVTLPPNYDWAKFGAMGSIIPMNDVINRINKIALPTRPLTNLVLGSIEGGISHYNIARETVLHFEVRSESADILKQIQEQLENIVEDVASNSGVRVTLDLFARREPGGLDIGHPLVRNARAIVTALGLQPMLYPTTSAMNALIDRKIPALTLGFTTGERRSELDEFDEAVAIPPMAAGLAQITAVLLAMDGGFCNGT